jgi:hypothetical protein
MDISFMDRMNGTILRLAQETTISGHKLNSESLDGARPLTRILHELFLRVDCGAEKMPYLFDIKGFNNNNQNKEARPCLKQSARTHYPFTPTEK